MATGTITPVLIAASGLTSALGGLFLYSHFSGDFSLPSIATPNFQIGQGYVEPVKARIIKGSNGLDDTLKTKYKGLLEDAFAARGVPVTVAFDRDNSTPITMVIYEVGASEIGPLPLNRAAQGVRPAADAYRVVSKSLEDDSQA